MATSEPWRYRCPRGHTSWQHRNPNGFNRDPKAEYYCDTCRKNGDDPHFDNLQDMKA